MHLVAHLAPDYGVKIIFLLQVSFNVQCLDSFEILFRIYLSVAHQLHVPFIFMKMPDCCNSIFRMLLSLVSS